MPTCCICEKPSYTNDSYSAEPLFKNSRCCGRCNRLYVIPYHTSVNRK